VERGMEMEDEKMFPVPLQDTGGAIRQAKRLVVISG
jgi:hypothetical protein